MTVAAPIAVRPSPVSGMAKPQSAAAVSRALSGSHEGIWMKRFAVAFGTAFIASVLTAETPAPAKPVNIGWVTTITKLHDNLLSVKVRDNIAADAQPAKYPNAIEMHWKYVPDEKGLPTARVLSQFAKLEADLDPIQGDRIGYLM